MGKNENFKALIVKEIDGKYVREIERRNISDLPVAIY